MTFYVSTLLLSVIAVYCFVKAIKIFGKANLRERSGSQIDGLTPSYTVMEKFNNNSNAEAPQKKMGTFPFMADANFCDGCLLCVNECPTRALELQTISPRRQTISPTIDLSIQET